jgi:HK97 gp10 family phage protein
LTLRNIKGFDEIQKLLDTLPAKIERNALRGALRAGANEILPVAVMNIHSISGRLAGSLKVGTSAERGGARASVYTRDFKAMWVEWGTRPHTITVRRERALNFGSAVVHSAHHPGADPHPFLLPAMDTQASAVLLAAGEYLKTRLSTKHGLDTADIHLEVE